MKKGRVTKTFMVEPHYWWVEAMDDGKVWIAVGEKKYLFSLREIVKLCMGLLKFAVEASDILDPRPEAIDKPIGSPAIDELEKFRGEAA